MESSDIKKTSYKVQKEWKDGKPSFTRKNSHLINSSHVTRSSSHVTEELPTLSPEQMNIVDLVCKKRENVFFTGEAGTGKSLIIKTIVRRFRASGISCHVTAPTGLAAVNIGGVTIYRWSGLGLMNGSREQLAAKVAKSQDAKSRWLDTKVLIIDEVSMFPPELFAKLDQVGRDVRKKQHRPFGGIQIVLTGDFFQLPPVSNSGKWLFSTDAFKKTIAHKIQLNKVFRQQGDSSLTEMLRKLRFCHPRDHVMLREFFGQLSRDLDDSDGIVPTVLEPRNESVNFKNEAELSKLPGPEFTLKSRDTFNGNSVDDITGWQQEQAVKSLNDSLRVVSSLKLKLGAQVMVMKNIYKDSVQLVNGNMGIVKWLMSSSKFHAIVQSGRGGGGKFNKSPQMFETIEFVEGIVKRGKPPGYYPRSKDIRALRDFPEEESESESVHFTNWETAKTLLLEIYETMEVQYRFTPNPKFDCTAFDALLPVVKFVDDSHGIRYVHMSAEMFQVFNQGGQNNSSNTEIGSSGLQRQQVPLILAWAMSIHKCQGQTLGKVKVDLSKAFCMGQAYVALSRVRSKDNLQVVGFEPSREKPSAEVVAFYKQFPRPFEREEKEKKLDKMVEELDNGDLDDLF